MVQITVQRSKENQKFIVLEVNSFSIFCRIKRGGNYCRTKKKLLDTSLTIYVERF